MARYEQNGVSFEPPPDWIDRTIVAFAAPTPAGSKNAPTIVLTPETMRARDTLRTHAERQLMELAKELHDFNLLDNRETTLGGVPAIFLRFTWASQSGALEQSMTLVERSVAGADRPGRTVLAFTTTALREDAHRNRAVFAQILRSVRFGSIAPASATPGPRPAPSLEAEPADIPMPGVRRDRR